MQTTDVTKDVPKSAAPAAQAFPLRLRRAAAVLLGALLVALSAQPEVVLPFTPVPLTLQGLAVLVVGGLLGPAAGAAALAAYLAMGAAGLPVFAGASFGAAKLVGPTGGYLLAFPLAAALVGRLASPSWPRATAAALVGMATIHAGGIAWLAVLGGDLGAAVRLGTVPFLAADLVKVALAGLLVARLSPATRRLV